MKGESVFTCLSHDVIVHELTHALLDGLRPHFTIPTQIDVLAFHEAFADLIACFSISAIATSFWPRSENRGAK